MNQPVVAAIVTSDRGVLLCSRHDGKPAWTFPAGGLEDGESVIEAAVRECLEETGIVVRPVLLLGERVHPKTGRTMHYVACAAVDVVDPVNGEPDDLSSVEWRHDWEALLPQVFEPVREHLVRNAV